MSRMITGWPRLFFIALLMAALPLRAQLFTLQHSFTNPPDGANPLGLVLSSNMFYGATANGGSFSSGSLFKVGLNGANYNNFYSFNSAIDGSSPNDLLVKSNLIYGTTQNGGTNGYGTIFSVTTNGGAFTLLRTFGAAPDAAYPRGGLVLSGTTLYGTTTGGGTNGNGTIFQIGTDGSGFTILHSFTNSPDGASPHAGLWLDNATLYGTCYIGGAYGNGGVFKMGTNGANYSLIYSFSNYPDAQFSEASLILYSNRLYGTSTSGGSSNYGAIFGLNTNGTGYSVLHSFTGPTFALTNSNGSTPSAGLTAGNGVLFGNSTGGGPGNKGTIFKINPDGTGFAVIRALLDTATGVNPRAPMILQSNALWGTTYTGGSDNRGAIFSLQLNPVISTQPQSATVTNGFPVSLSVVATNDSGLNYQWFFNTNSALSGQTNRTLNFSSITTNDAGSYTVLITDQIGAITSSPAILTVVVVSKPSFILQPQNVTVTNGGSASFTVSASGDAPLYYQWYFNTNTLLVNQTNTSLAFASATTNNAGTYQVVVTNSFGTVTSSPALLTVITAVKPSINVQPQSLTATNGTFAQLTVSASGSSPLYYQWYFNTNTLLAGQTTTNLNFANVTTNNVGIYIVVITNVAGAVTSSPASLSVVSGPSITSQPQGLNVTNADAANFTVTVNGDSPLSYQWYFNTNTLLAGQTATNLYFASTVTSNTGFYTVVVANPVGAVTSSPAALNVSSASKPIITAQPVGLTLTNGAVSTFAVTAVGQNPLKYQWYFNTNLFSTNLLGIILGNKTNSTLTFTNVTTNTGYYSVIITNTLGKATSSPALLTVVSRPVITLQPQSVTVTNGDPVGFTADAIGAGQLRFQWLFRTNTLVAGATNATLNFTTATTNLAGVYSLRVTNNFGAVTSSFALLNIISPPAISTQPQNFAATNGNPASFLVVATGGGTLTYQWYFNTNNPISGETAPSLNLPAVSTNDAGTYTVVVANELGAITSSPAILTVSLNSKPIIATQPSDQTVTYSNLANFSVTAIGKSPLTYQWYSNNVVTQAFGAAKRLTAQTNASLTFTAGFTNVSYYSVIVSNSLGLATSGPAMLTVIAAPLIISNPQPVSVASGDAASFSVGALGANPLKYQWYFNTNSALTNQLGNLLAGRTNGTLDFTATSNGLVGRYSVIITNLYGKATSSPALLSLASGSPPSITLQPLSRTITNGAAVTFLSAANGTNPLSYQWFFNTNQFIAGATNTALTFSNANQPGTYSMRVTNTFGAATSTPALLTVVGQPLMLTASFDPVSGSYAFSYVNLAGSTNRLWASTNLAATNFWRAIATNVMATNALWFFTDVNTAATNAARFYRFSTP